jgi:ribosomal protein S18 acetylase RimI-like enzyme
MEIKLYNQSHEKDLLSLIFNEGEEWKDYSDFDKWPFYLEVINESITYLLYDQSLCVGYIRTRKDGIYGIYVYDLLVTKSHRGKSYGKLLIDHVHHLYPNQELYIMSDVDPYYIKQGFIKVGTLFSYQAKE